MTDIQKIFSSCDWDEVIRTLTNDPSQLVNCSSRFMLGISLHHRAQYKASIRELTTLTDESPHYVEAYLYSGLSAMALCDFCLASHLFIKVLPTAVMLASVYTSTLYYNLSSTYSALGLRQLAFKSLKFAILYNPESPDSYISFYSFLPANQHPTLDSFVTILLRYCYSLPLERIRFFCSVLASANHVSLAQTVLLESLYYNEAQLRSYHKL